MSKPGTKENRDALRVCAGCPVALECYEAAVSMDKHGIFGIWGGVQFSWDKEQQ